MIASTPYQKFALDLLWLGRSILSILAKSEHPSVSAPLVHRRTVDVFFRPLGCFAAGSNTRFEGVLESQWLRF